MNLKRIILILNILYLIVAIGWAIVDISFETVLAITGGLVSFFTFFVANNNWSFRVTNKVQNVDNKNANIRTQINAQDYTENNYK